MRRPSSHRDSTSNSACSVAIWSHNRYIIIALVLIILGHWSLILQGVQLKAVWVDELPGCVITEANNKILAAIFIYSMCFDLFILLVNTYKLLGLNSAVRAVGTSRLSKMIFEDGLIFFFIAYVKLLRLTGSATDCESSSIGSLPTFSPPSS